MSSFTKEKISLAPNNQSAWNYLRGVLDFTHTPYASLASFVQPYTAASAPASSEPEDSVVDLENPRPSAGAELPCVAALEFQADIYEVEGGDATGKAVQVCPQSQWYSHENKLLRRSGNLLQMSMIQSARST